MAAISAYKSSVPRGSLCDPAAALRRQEPRTALESLETRTLLSALTVTTTADSGPGSLRDAIDAANTTPGFDTIEFNIGSGGQQTISPLSPLPTITDAVSIDATTQPGYAGTPLIELDGTSAGAANGLFITGGGSTVRGFVINRFQLDGVRLEQGDGNMIASNYLGTDVTGTVSHANGASGIKVAENSDGNTIGTNSDGINDSSEGNLISGNSNYGVLITGMGGVDPGPSDNRIAGNTIGMQIDGMIPLGNQFDGVRITASARSNIIGTDGDGASDLEERNLLSGNGWAGVTIADVFSSFNRVAGNYIGVTGDGLAAAPNQHIESAGVQISNARNNIIGTNGDGQGDAVEGNVISGNEGAGVRIDTHNGDDNWIAGNIIGLNAMGKAAIPNGRSGILMFGGADRNLIGTNADGVSDELERNVISGHSKGSSAGISLAPGATQDNVIAGNFIGTDITGTLSIGNDTGISVASPGAAGNHQRLRIGTDGDGIFDEAERNIISGNRQQIDYGDSDGIISGNYIGTDVTGATEIVWPGVHPHGIFIRPGSQFNQIGGQRGTTGNVIALGILDHGGNDNWVSGNMIGMDVTGTPTSNNIYAPITLEGGIGNVNNIIGSNADGVDDHLEGNIIRGGNQPGVAVRAGAYKNRISGNSIFGSVGLGIDLAWNGPTPNDPGDTDEGDNGLQNFPVLTNVTPGGTTTVTGSLSSMVNTTYRVEFFANSALNAGGYAEGERYLGFANVTTDGNGDVSFSATLAAATATGEFITATATDPDGNTSEFSDFVVPIDPTVTISGRVFDDIDNDGLYEPGDGDAGLVGVTVMLTGTDDVGPVSRSTVTLADGTYTFDDVCPGNYSLLQTQPGDLLDGIETAGSLGGTVDNSQDSNSISDINILGGSGDATGYNFAEIRPSEVLGFVWEDFNNDSEVNFGEKAIEGVTVNLSGVDDRGNSVSHAVQTDVDGVYMFIDLRPGEYAISEVQPAGLNDGQDVVGTVNGVPTGDNSANDVISGVVLALPRSIAENYNFGERPVEGGEVVAGQTATIGFWQNNNGKALIEALNGGATSTQLGDWLTATFPNMYGASAGANDLTGFSNSQVADFYSELFRRKQKEAVQLGLGGPVKTDAQVFATALAVYVTNSTLAGNTAASYGFLVTENGVGVSTFNVGESGEAFDVADGSDVSVLGLLLATNDKSLNGLLYDRDGDGDADDSLETLFRTLANDVYSAINEQGDV